MENLCSKPLIKPEEMRSFSDFLDLGPEMSSNFTFRITYTSGLRQFPPANSRCQSPSWNHSLTQKGMIENQPFGRQLLLRRHCYLTGAVVAAG